MDTGIYYQDRDIVVKRERYYKDKRYAVLNIWDEGIPLGPQLLQTYGGNDYENALHFA